MGLDISKTDNKVTLVDNNKSITVTDNNKDIFINVTQPITSTAEVSTAGPRGATGDTGATGQSGSAATSGPDTSVQFRDGITTSGSSDFTFIKATGGVTATSFSGSFSGSGADLINIPASGITGLNLSRISSGSVTASISPNSGLVVNTNISASSYVSASSFWAPPGVINQLTASYAISASVEITKEVSSSHANTADYALAGPFLSSSAQIANDISGSLGTNATLIRSLTAAGISGSWQNQTSSMSVLSASYATTASYVLNAVSASYAVSASHEIIKEVSSSHADTASFAQSGTGIFSGSFSGSYAGDGSNLTGIVASKWTGSNPISREGDVTISGSLTVSGSGQIITGSLLIHSIDTPGVTVTSNNDPAEEVKIYDGKIALEDSGYDQVVIRSNTSTNAMTGNITLRASTLAYGFLLARDYHNAQGISWLNSGLRLGERLSDPESAPNQTSPYCLSVTGSVGFEGDTTISGSLIVSASGNPGLTVYSSGSAVFNVIGSEGTLFSVDDDLNGMLFTTNDISGLPILQASASGETFIGKSPQSLYTTAVISATSASSTASLCTLSTSSYDGAFFDYTMTSGSNAKAGNIMSVWNGGTVNYTEVSTTDIGTTSGINFEVIISASTAQLVAVTDSTDPNTWKVKTIVRSI